MPTVVARYDGSLRCFVSGMIPFFYSLLTTPYPLQHPLDNRRPQRLPVEAHARLVAPLVVLIGRQDVAEPDVGQAADDRILGPRGGPGTLLDLETEPRRHLARNADDQQVAHAQ